ncbi:MAG: proline dehydrogenase family protein [bacterium]|nr:proline dehydrogenase family protein [bacterium]
MLNIYQTIEKAREYFSLCKSYKLTLSEKQKGAVELAALMLSMSLEIQTEDDRAQIKRRANVLNDAHGKSFFTAMTDQFFRSTSSRRLVNQLTYLIQSRGIPKSLAFGERIKIRSFLLLGPIFPSPFVALAKRSILNEVGAYIIPDTGKRMNKAMSQLSQKGINANINYLGEAITGSQQANERLEHYCQLLAHPDVHVLSIKLSGIMFPVHVLDWDHSLEIAVEKLSHVFRAAKSNPIGDEQPHKFVYLDMENYHELHFTVLAFKQALSLPEFHDLYAGIALQSYIPDSLTIQEELTVWAMDRVSKGGAPIRIRLVKGANMGLESIVADENGWALPTYSHKIDTDSQFKRMLQFGIKPIHAMSAHLAIGSHNLFDIAYALLERAEKGVEQYVSFELLYGMAEPMRKTLQMLIDNTLTYCPATSDKDIHFAIAYLVRRIDEATSPDNYLTRSFRIKPGSVEWKFEAERFLRSFGPLESPAMGTFRVQNRLTDVYEQDALSDMFKNDSPTDVSISANREWVHGIFSDVQAFQPPSVSLRQLDECDMILNEARSAQASWASRSIENRAAFCFHAAKLIRERRGTFITLIMANTHKPFADADAEVCEAIDFLHYYPRQYNTLLADKAVTHSPKGVVMVASPWNFPLAIPIGGIVAAIITGNTVLFKPAPEAQWVGRAIAELFWEVGIPETVLQFIPCEEQGLGSALVKDSRIDTIVLTGSSTTASAFLNMRPTLDLCAETGGKNSIIVTALADRELAITEIVASAFGYAGQKCSAASLLILEAEVYDDPAFMRALKDAAQSLCVDEITSLNSDVGPLIGEANESIRHAVDYDEPGESWLLKPRFLSDFLLTPGIKLGVKEGSFSHLTECFGPLLFVMRAQNLRHAIKLANGTSYGLTAGLFSLDSREHNTWVRFMKAGNYYINRRITGAIVGRQPFGGVKLSSYGRGFKAGGPLYLFQMVTCKDICDEAKSGEVIIPESWPMHVKSVTEFILANTSFDYSEQLCLIRSVWNYLDAQKTMTEPKDLTQLKGQHNWHYWVPIRQYIYRYQETDSPLDQARLIVAALISGVHLHISTSQNSFVLLDNATIQNHFPTAYLIEEDEQTFIARLSKYDHPRLRILGTISEPLLKGAHEHFVRVLKSPILEHGLLELSHYMREVSVCESTHRYGSIVSPSAAATH